MFRQNTFVILLISLDFEMRNHALSYVITARSALPLKSLNTWLFWCISQLAASNPQSCMSSEVNGFVSHPLSAYWDMPASGFNLPGSKTSANMSLSQSSFLFLSFFDVVILLLVDIKLLKSSGFLSKYWHSEGQKGFNPCYQNGHEC